MSHSPRTWWLVVGPGLTPVIEIEYSCFFSTVLSGFMLFVSIACFFRPDAQLSLDALESLGKQILISLDKDQIIEAMKL